MKARTAARWLAHLAGAAPAVYSSLCTVYVLGLTAAAAAPPRAVPPRPAEWPLFDIVIPAHNEATTLPTLLASLAALDYPPERRRIHVVADNCTDGTATIACAAGAHVHERDDPQRVGKGYALVRGLAEALALPGAPHDGIVIVDADSEVAPDFLRALAGPLTAGAQALQAHYRVRNAGSAPATALRDVALCLYHYVRPRGRARLGLSAGFRGNGMCFRRSVAGLGWDAFGLAEDVEQHLRLLVNGVHVTFVAEALVWADMPVTLAASTSQNHRWERGRLDTLRKLPSLIRLAVHRRDPSALDAAFEQAVAPLSVIVLAAFVAACCGLVGRSRWLALTGIGSLAGQALYVLGGLRIAGERPAAYRALASAPAYALWKGGLWLRAIAQRPVTWVRTDRPAGAPSAAVGEW